MHFEFTTVITYVKYIFILLPSNDEISWTDSTLTNSTLNLRWDVDSMVWNWQGLPVHGTGAHLVCVPTSWYSLTSSPSNLFPFFLFLSERQETRRGIVSHRLQLKKKLASSIDAIAISEIWKHYPPTDSPTWVMIQHRKSIRQEPEFLVQLPFSYIEGG